MNTEIEKLTAKELDHVFVETTNRGPFVEDMFYRIYAGRKSWRLPKSQVSWEWVTSLPNINLEKLTLAQFSVENAFFLIWTKRPELIISESRKTELQARFDRFLHQQFSIDSKFSAAISKSLVESFEDGTRSYHTLRHIARCLSELDAVTDEKIDKGKIELAIWYHDLVYIPTSKRNEEDSAQRLTDELGAFKSDISLPTVKSMILASKHSSGSDYDADTNLFLDIDLSILGACRFEYEIYAREVRKEYELNSVLRFYFGRKQLLNRLMRQRIFRTLYMHEKYEANARENIACELKHWHYRLMPVAFC